MAILSGRLDAFVDGSPFRCNDNNAEDDTMIAGLHWWAIIPILVGILLFLLGSMKLKNDRVKAIRRLSKGNKISAYGLKPTAKEKVR